MWIKNKKFDQIFFIRSTLLTPCYFFIYFIFVYFLNLDPEEVAFTLYVIFLVIFDQPHIFQSFSRAYADKVEFKRNKTKHISLPFLFLLVGPLAFFTDSKDILIFLFTYYGMWHVFKQNVGILKIYQIKTKTSELWKKWEVFLYYIFFICVLIPDLIFSDLFQNSFGYSRVQNLIDDVLYTVFIIILIVFSFILKNKVNREKVSKVQFLSSTLFNYGFLYLVINSQFRVPLIAFVAFDTIYHNIQYQGFIRVYQEKTFSPLFIKKFMVYSIVYSIIGVTLYFGAMRLPPYGEIISLMLMMIVFYHYYLDSFIWKVGKAPELRKILLNEN